MGMLLSRHPGVPCPLEDPEAERVGFVAAKSENVKAMEVPHLRPFVERRHNRKIEESWQEALACLHQHLLGYQETTEELSKAEEKYRAIFEDALVGIFQASSDGRPLRVNRAMARIFGYDSPEAFLADAAKEGLMLFIDPSQWDQWSTASEDGDAHFGVEELVRSCDGVTKWVQLNVRAIRDRGRILRYEGTVEDITVRKGIEVRTHLLAYYDALTGLPNRTLFDEQFAGVLAEADQRNERTALLRIELDKFKTINDSLGHLFGDRLLREIAERIKAAAGEQSIVARVAGAEFAIVLPGVKEAREVAATAESVVARLGAEFSFFDQSLIVFCNLGISMFPENGRDVETMMKCADIAMCSARELGSNKFRFFTPEMNVQMLERQTLENGLRQALAKSEFFLVYQPQVDIRTGVVTGLEALLRWQHPQLGLIPPAKFIGVAENCGLIVPIGEWVLRTACSQARKWQDEGLPAVPVAVNVSAIQFRQQGFCELIRGVLEDTGLHPKYLELELTESLLLTNEDLMISISRELREMGVMLAIDDFGTGYSSLGYLRHFKVNRLKIDRSIVQDVSVNADDAAITIAIINMANALNLAVLAEGVETEAQLSFLWAQHCYTIQGFYFAKPASVDQIVEKLRMGFAPHALAKLA